MHSGGKKYTFFLFPIIEVTNDNIVTIIPSNSLTQCLPLHEMLPLRVKLNISQKQLQLCIRVGVTMSNVHSVVVIWDKSMSTFKLQRKTKRVEEITTLPFQVVLVVTNVVPVAVPAHVLRLVINLLLILDYFYE